MNHVKTPTCAICGEEQSANRFQFLIAENSWEDKLTILQWNEHVASRAGIRLACGIDHVEELVIHWLTTGRLDYPFARSALGAAGWPQASTQAGRVDITGARTIAELAVHRESMETLLMENPQSLQGVLDALLDSLRQEITVESEANSRLAAERRVKREPYPVSAELELQQSS
jgi:hypothetical protein